MEIQGTVTWVGDIQSGTTSQGKTWQKRQFVIEYIGGQYPKRMLFETFDDKVISALREGLSLLVQYDVEVREYNGRLFNSIRIWRDGVHSRTPKAQPTPASQAAPQPSDELPF